MWNLFFFICASILSIVNTVHSRSANMLKRRSENFDKKSVRTINPTLNKAIKNNKVLNATIHPDQKQNRKSIKKNIQCQTGICGNWDPEEIQKYEDLKYFVEKKVKQGANTLSSHKLSRACHIFAKDPQWSFGDQTLFIINKQGNCYLHGNKKDMLWRQIDSEDLHLLQKLSPDGDWILHKWNGKTQYSFIMPVAKGNELFFIGMGLYSDAPCLRLKHILQTAHDIAQNEGVDTLCNKYIQSGYSSALHIDGDMGLTVFNDNGYILADINNIHSHTKNIFDIQNNNGEFIYKSLVSCMSEQDEIEFKDTSSTFTKVIVCKKINVSSLYSDSEDNIHNLYIVGTYYPSISPQDVVNFVTNAAAHLRTNGPEKGLSDLNNIHDPFTQKPLRAITIDMNGTICADSYNINVLGKKGTSVSFYKEFVPQVLEKVKKDQKGWISFGSQSKGHGELYYQLVETIKAEYIICTPIYPFDRRYSIEIATRQIEEILKTSSLANTCNIIQYNPSDISSPYIHMDLYTPDGLSIVSSDHTQPWHIYKQSQEWKTIKKLAKAGGGFYSLKNKSGNKQAYVRYTQLPKTGLDQENIPQKSKVIRHGRPPIVKREEIQNFSDGVIIIAWFYL